LPNNNGARPAHGGSVDQPGEVVDRLRQMADMLAGALAQGEQKVAEAKQEAAGQIAAVQAELEKTKQEASSAWQEVERHR